MNFSPMRHGLWVWVFCATGNILIHLCKDIIFELHLDASPWGLGGVLTRCGQCMSWFSCALSDAELAVLELTRGSHRSQQAVEALCALVALRAWSQHWRNQRLQIRVQSDSISALVLAVRLKTSGRASGIIARDMALDLAESNFMPLIAEHVPGVANLVPDLLSRRFQPGKDFVLPSALTHIPECRLPPRTAAFFRSLTPPQPPKLV